MGQKEKLMERVKSRPRNLTFEEMASLLGYLGYTIDNKGRTSGSRIMFVNEGFQRIILHKPHPQKELKMYQVNQIVDMLEKEGLL